MQDHNLFMDLLITGIAGWQIVETWHHGSIFRSAREKLKEMKNDDTKSWRGRKLWELFGCPFCLSHWVCLGCAAVVMLTDSNSIWRWPIYGLVATRISQFLNDVTYNFTRSPGDGEEIVIDETQTNYEMVDEPTV